MGPNETDVLAERGLRTPAMVEALYPHGYGPTLNILRLDEAATGASHHPRARMA